MYINLIVLLTLYILDNVRVHIAVKFKVDIEHEVLHFQTEKSIRNV